ncbi:MAG: sulfotransferase domain-containing protein [Bacteroidota bacterium]|nr:sulfotransferase domain-containing protein [Bacteroidota bacterium]
MNLPNLIIGGAPKCGTSSLYFWLAKHPEVFASRTKEPFFFFDKINRFNKNCNCIEHNINAYSNYFKDKKDEKISFEATAAYLYSNNAITGFSSFKNPPKIIFIFREPSAQIYSHYKMERYRTKRTNLDLEEYVNLPKINMYVDYATHLNKWQKKYPNQLIKILIFEDLIRNKRKILQEIAKFLQIDDGFYKDFNFEHRNESVVIRSSAMHRIGTKLQPFIPHKLQSKLLPLYLKWNSKGSVSCSNREKEILNKLKEEYSYVKDELRKINHDLPLYLWNQ